MKVEMKVSGLEGVLDTLRSLPPEIVSKNGGPVRSALRRGALVILREASLNLARATGDLDVDGNQYSTGLLLKNLRATRGKPPASGKGERYLVRVRRVAYPRKGKEVVTTLKTAQILEYGSTKQPAEPWLRPAFYARAPEAIKTIEVELRKGVDRIVRRLAKKGGA